MSNRGRILLIAVVVLVVLLFLSARGIAGFYTDELWYDALGQTDVFWGVLGAKIALAAIFTVLFASLLVLNLWIADRLAPRTRAPGPEEQFIERYQQIVGRRAWLFRIAVGLLFGLVAGVPVSSQWKDWLLFTHSVSFGQKDAQFGVDIGFYVFKLPFLTFVVDWLFAALVIILVVTAVAHYLNGGIRLQVQGRRVTPQVKLHLSVLLAILALLKAAGYWLQRYKLVTSSRGVVDGATYTDVNAQLPAINLLFLISLLAAVLLIINVWQRGWRLPVIAVGLWGLVAVVAGAAYPAFVQRFQVQPAESTKERPFIERNIAATRTAMGTERRGGDPVSTGRHRAGRAGAQPGDAAERAPDRHRGDGEHVPEAAGTARLLPDRLPRRRPLSDRRPRAADRAGRPRAEPRRPTRQHVGGPPPRVHARLRRGARAGEPGEQHRAAELPRPHRPVEHRPVPGPTGGVLRREAQRLRGRGHEAQRDLLRRVRPGPASQLHRHGRRQHGVDRAAHRVRLALRRDQPVQLRSHHRAVAHPLRPRRDGAGSICSRRSSTSTATPIP